MTRNEGFSHMKKNDVHFFHVLQFWVPSATRLHCETHTKWKFEPFATSEYQFCWRTEENKRSREDLRFAIGDIFIVSQSFWQKNIKTPQLQSRFPRKFYKQPMVLMATLTYQNDLRNILAMVLSILKISPLPPEMTWQTGHKSHCAPGITFHCTSFLSFW